MDSNQQQYNGPAKNRSQNTSSRKGTAAKRNRESPESSVQRSSSKRKQPFTSVPPGHEVMQAYQDRGYNTQPQQSFVPYGQAQNTHLVNDASYQSSYQYSNPDARSSQSPGASAGYTQPDNYGLGPSIFQRQAEQPFIEDESSETSDQDMIFPPEFHAENDVHYHGGNNASDIFTHDSETNKSSEAQDAAFNHEFEPAESVSNQSDDEMEVDGEEPQFAYPPPSPKQSQASVKSKLQADPQAAFHHQIPVVNQHIPVVNVAPAGEGSEYHRDRDPRVAARSAQQSQQTSPEQTSQRVDPQSHVQRPVPERSQAESTQHLPVNKGPGTIAAPSHNDSQASVVQNGRPSQGVSPKKVRFAQAPTKTLAKQSVLVVTSAAPAPAPNAQVTAGPVRHIDNSKPGNHQSTKYSPGVVRQQPQASESTVRFSDADLQAFKPEALDRQIYNWRSQGLPWVDVETTLLTVCKKPLPNMTQVKLRQQLLDAKIALARRVAGTGGSGASASTQRVVAAAGEVPQQIRTQAPQQVTYQSPQQSKVSPPQPAKSQDSDAATLAVLREKDKLAWQQERNELLERIRAGELALLEEKQASEDLKNELNGALTTIQIKAQAEEELAEQKEANRDLNKRLREEQVLRAKAERDWREHQKAEHRKVLAQAATTRGVAKAKPAGFSFESNEISDKDEKKDEKGETPEKKGVARKKQQQPDMQMREDGHPSEGGKTISPAMVQTYLKHLEKSAEEEASPSDQGVPEILQEENLTYYVYSVKRKQWRTGSEEPDLEGVVCNQYTYMNQANASVQNEILRPWGGDGIAIEPEKDFTLHGGRDDNGMAWSQIDVPTGHVKVWVDRELHTAYEGALPLFEAAGFVSRTVYSVKQEIRKVDGDGTKPGRTDNVALTAVDESDELYTTFDLANKKASDKAFELVWGVASSRYDEVLRKNEAASARRQILEDMEDRKELFSEELEESGNRVKICVVTKTLVGPRN